MVNIWIRVMKKHRLHLSETIPFDGIDAPDTLAEKLRQMDLPSPIWLKKHQRELAQFNLTSFARGDFIEPVDFDRLDISIIDDEKPTQRNQDPRNAF